MFFVVALLLKFIIQLRFLRNVSISTIMNCSYAEICSRDASIYYLLQELFQELPKQTKETMKQADIT